jgi:hypothetical protein
MPSIIFFEIYALAKLDGEQRLELLHPGLGACELSLQRTYLLPFRLASHCADLNHM